MVLRVQLVEAGLDLRARHAACVSGRIVTAEDGRAALRAEQSAEQAAGNRVAEDAQRNVESVFGSELY